MKSLWNAFQEHQGVVKPQLYQDLAPHWLRSAASQAVSRYAGKDDLADWDGQTTSGHCCNEVTADDTDQRLCSWEPISVCLVFKTPISKQESSNAPTAAPKHIKKHLRFSEFQASLIPTSDFTQFEASGRLTLRSQTD